MLKNYITTALRNLLKYKLHSFINIFGLAVGLTAAALILMFVRNEWNYDTHWAEQERIYRVEAIIRNQQGQQTPTSLSMGPAQAELAAYFPEFKSVGRLFNFSHGVRYGDRLFDEKVTYVDPDFLEIFQLKKITGSVVAASLGAAAALISESTAAKYFGDEAAIGQILTLETGQTYEVVGVFADLPRTSHLSLSIVARFDPALFGFRRWLADSWFSSMLYTYAKLKPAHEIAAVEKGLDDFIRARVPENNTVSDQWLTLTFRPVANIHFDSPTSGALKPGGDRIQLLTFGLIALSILGIAGANFANIISVQSARRSKEVAMRKILGATRRRIFHQFFGETFLQIIFAVLLAALFLELSLPWFDWFTARMLEMSTLLDPLTLAGIVGLILVVGIATSLYPAVLVSANRPAAILRGQKDGGQKTHLKSTLTILQFAVTMALAAGVFVIHSQLSFVQEQPGGYAKKNILLLKGLNRGSAFQAAPSMAEKIRVIEGVEAVGASALIPSDAGGATNEISLPGRAEPVVLETLPVGFGFFETYGVDPLAGRLFSSDFSTDTQRFRVNRQAASTASAILSASAVQFLGLGNPASAIGQTFDLKNFDGSSQLTVVGVVPDIRFGSARDAIKPVLFIVDETRLFNFSVRYRPEALPAIVDNITRLWSEAITDVPIQLEFFEENIAALYQGERSSQRILGGFLALAIILSSLGLYALSSLEAGKRTREVGIRKALGASAMRIVLLLILQFSKPVLIAILIFWPVAWYFLDAWLAGFVYRIDLTPIPFMITGLAVLVISWLTVGAHAIRVARANPVYALRCE